MRHTKAIVFLSFLFFFLFPGFAGAQNISLLKIYEDSIMRYSKTILQTKDDERKDKLNEKLWYFVNKAAQSEASINYGFDTLNYVSVLTSPDKKLRLFTWTIRSRSGKYHYYGLAQSYLPGSKTYRIQKLNDYTDRIGSRADAKTLSPKKWYGAYYYRIIQNKSGSRTYYTLLGWKGYDKIITKKVVEIALLKSNGDIVFGYPIFNIRNYEYVKNKRARRLIYTYSSRVRMYLEYDKQTIVIEKKKSKSKSHGKTRGFTAQNKEVKEKVKVKTITKPMIVADRLVPPTPELEEVYEFYIPETNVIDGLLFENNRWNYYPDIDARNKTKDENGQHPKKPLYYDLY
jgi:hypothetical protein